MSMEQGVVADVGLLISPVDSVLYFPESPEASSQYINLRIRIFHAKLGTGRLLK
jgi:hypothetical protein